MLTKTLSCTILLSFSLILPVFGQAKRPVLIRDTDKAEGKEDSPDVAKPKEYDPAAAEKNLTIGDFYYKKGNYDAAVDRYLDALGYKPGFAKARDALQRACNKALEEHRAYVRRNPKASADDLDYHRTRIARLEKALAELKASKPPQ